MSSADEMQTTPDDELKAARAELRSARDEVHSLVAALQSEDAITDEELRQYQSQLKGLGRLANSGDPDHIRRGLYVYAEMKARCEGWIVDRLDRGFLPDGEARDNMDASVPSTEAEDAGTAEKASSRGNGRRKGARQVLFLGESRGGGKPIDELLEKHHKLIAKKQEVLFYMKEKGLSSAEAVEKAGIERTARWARDLRSDYEEEGFFALLDGRWFRNHKSTVMTPEVRKLVMVEMARHRAAGPTAIWKNVEARCRERDLEPPSCPSVKKFMGSLSQLENAFIEDDEEGYRRQLRPVTRFEMADHGNDRFQMDHTQLDIWVRAKVDGKWVPRRPWLTAIIDAYSRSVAGFFLSTAHPDAISISLAVHHAVTAKDEDGWLNRGLPNTVQHDHGGDFKSDTVMSWFASLGVLVDPAPPRYPEADGKVERFFKTLDSSLLRRLDGHAGDVGTTEGAATKRVAEFLPLNALKKAITAWITDIYHQTLHSTINEKPAERWERTVHLREPADESVLRSLLLRQDKTRVVQNDGITLTVDGKQGRYWCPDLAWYVKQEVSIAYHPESSESVAVYCASSGEFIGEAYDMDADDCPYDIKDVKRVRGQMQNGLKARLKQYREDVAEHDRKKAGGDGWVDPGPEAPPTSPDGEQNEGSDDGNAKSGTPAKQSSSTAPAPLAQGQSEDEDLEARIEQFKEQDRAAS